MKPHYFRVLFAVGGASLLSSCQPQSKGPEVAKIGNSIITAEDFKNRLQGTPTAYQQYTATPEGRRQFLNLLIREKVLIEEARKAKLDKEDTYRTAVTQFKKKSDADFKDYQESLLVEMVLARLRAKDITVTDAEVRSYYDAHQADFTRPVEVQASHILVTSEEEAQKVLTRLKNGEAFETVARLVSMDPATAARGGKLAPFTKGSLVPEFENAVMPLKNGQTTGPVKSSFGYHIIKKLGQKTLPAKSFDAAKEDIKNRLAEREKFDQWVTQAQSAVGVKIDEQVLASVAVAPRAQGDGGSIR